MVCAELRGSIRLWVGLFLVAALAQPTFGQLPPEETVTALRTADEAEISLYASEPLITNPAAIDIDTQGRVWVAEIEHYRKPPREDGADKIKVLEDTNGDGRADRVTVFAEGVFSPMSICVAGPKVYVATSPDLWLYEDNDGDLRADGPPKKLLTGFGGRNHDHGAHSLVLGPDHKWWMSHGDRGFDVTGTDGSHIKFQWGAVLRGELDGSELETVAVNFRNPYEVCVSSFGESFLSDNDNDGNFSTRICWILDGGNYGWFGRPPAKVDASIPFGEGWHFRAHVPGFVPGTLVTGFGSPCGICFYEGDAFGPEWKNTPIHTDAGPREVRLYPHEPQGAGMRANNRVVVASDGDDYFRPDDVCTAPDGSLLIADWYDGTVGGHAYNNPKQGRIYRLSPRGANLKRREKPGPYDNVADAIVGLQSPNLATQYLARERLLAEGEASIEALSGLLDSDEPNYVARALWVLDRIGGAGRQKVIEHLSCESPAMRALAVRILRRHGDEFASEILGMANDPAVEVRREVLLALPTISGDAGTETLVAMAMSEDLSDRYMLETINIAGGGRQEALFQHLVKQGDFAASTIQLLRVLDPKQSGVLLLAAVEEQARPVEQRLAIVDALATMPNTEAGEAVISLLKDDRRPVRERAMAALDRKLSEGWSSLQENEQLRQALSIMLAEDGDQQAALDLITAHKLVACGDDVIKLCRNAEAASVARVTAIETAVALQLASASEVLPELARGGQERSLRQAAAQGLVRLQAWPEVEHLFSEESHSSDDLRASVVDTLLETTDGALVLLQLVKNERLIGKLRDKAIAKAVTHPDSNVRILFESFLPEDQRPVRLGSAIEPEKILALEGDVDRGREIFFRSTAAQCNTCHAIDGVGGSVGPDLSQIGRKYEPAVMLETILDPSKAIGPEYVAHLLETDAGQVFVGFIVEQSDDVLVLKDARGNLIRTASEDVVALEPQSKSLMPELVLRDVTAQDAADLLAYLSSLRNSVQHAGHLRMLGPFAVGKENGLAKEFGPESNPERIDLATRYQDHARTRQWRMLEAARSESPGREAINVVDLDGYCQSQGGPRENVVIYAAGFADSTAEQEATLLVAGGDPLVVMLNGETVHARKQRVSAESVERIPVQLHEGRNVVLMKTHHAKGPNRVLGIAIESNANVQWRTE